jgi:hypothetical protein
MLTVPWERIGSVEDVPDGAICRIVGYPLQGLTEMIDKGADDLDGAPLRCGSLDLPDLGVRR